METQLTVLPAPISSFRIAYTIRNERRYRDFMAESPASFASWVRHLNDEIQAHNKNPEESYMRTESEVQRSFSHIVGDIAVNQAAVRDANPELEAEVLLLRERCAVLEKENAALKASTREDNLLRKSTREDDHSAEAAAAAQLMNALAEPDEPKKDSAEVRELKDKVEDLEFKLANCKKQLKLAKEQVKKLSESASGAGSIGGH